MSLEPLLEMQGISKTFNGLRVLKNVGLKVYPGEIHALMGENGAGKSTLMKILSGAYQADPGGEIRIGDNLVNDKAPGERGILVHCDLANYNAVTTILTEDVGLWAGHGENSGFLLLGRAEGAAAKGCSLAVDEFVKAAAA